MAGWWTKPETSSSSRAGVGGTAGFEHGVFRTRAYPRCPVHPVTLAPGAPRVLIADDQQDVLKALQLLLKAEGFGLEAATSPPGILSALESQDFDVVLMDLNYARDTTSGREGLDLIPQIKAFDPTLPIIVMTAWGSIDGAVEAIRKGAGNYVEKPWDNERLLSTLRTQIELGRALRRAHAAATRHGAPPGPQGCGYESGPAPGGVGPSRQRWLR